MKYEINDKEYEVIIIKKNNKNTYLRVKEDLKIYITTNYFTSKPTGHKRRDSYARMLGLQGCTPQSSEHATH